MHKESVMKPVHLKRKGKGGNNTLNQTRRCEFRQTTIEQSNSLRKLIQIQLLKG